jgi:flagellar basal-body rod protein FlgF
MDRLIYTAATGMTAAMNRQRVIASNLANTQTIGFRAETLLATPMTLDGPQLEVRALNSTQVKGAEMKQGSIITTGRNLDIALQGDAMLAVQAGDGGEGYTRRGDLTISATGLLQNGDGLPVLGQNGPITVPLDADVSISPKGEVMVRVPNNGVLPTDETAEVIPGSLEQSNVRPTEVLVEMVEAQRSFDMRTKLIATARELDEGGANLMRITPA